MSILTLLLLFSFQINRLLLRGVLGLPKKKISRKYKKHSHIPSNSPSLLSSIMNILHSSDKFVSIEESISIHYYYLFSICSIHSEVSAFLILEICVFFVFPRLSDQGFINFIELFQELGISFIDFLLFFCFQFFVLFFYHPYFLLSACLEVNLISFSNFLNSTFLLF